MIVAVWVSFGARGILKSGIYPENDLELNGIGLVLVAIMDSHVGVSIKEQISHNFKLSHPRTYRPFSTEPHSW